MEYRKSCDDDLGAQDTNIFDWNNIVSDQDLKKAERKKQTYYEKKETTVEKIKKGEVTLLTKAKVNEKSFCSFSITKQDTFTKTPLKNGVRFKSPNPFIFLVPRAGLEPARWGSTEGF